MRLSECDVEGCRKLWLHYRSEGGQNEEELFTCLSFRAVNVSAVAAGRRRKMGTGQISSHPCVSL